MRDMEGIADSVLNSGANPFWHLFFLQYPGTWFLLNHRYYQCIQSHLTTAVCSIKIYIISLNTQRGIRTPFMADVTLANCEPNYEPTLHYNWLKDSTHSKHYWYTCKFKTDECNWKVDIDAPVMGEPDSQLVSYIKQIVWWKFPLVYMIS